MSSKLEGPVHVFSEQFYPSNLPIRFTSTLYSDVGSSHVFRVIEQCCFNSVLDPFNGQTVNFIVKPPKVIKSRTYVKKASLKHY